MDRTDPDWIVGPGEHCGNQLYRMLELEDVCKHHVDVHVDVIE